MTVAMDRLRAKNAAEVAARCGLAMDTAPPLDDRPDAGTYLQRLLERGATNDALRFLCHAIEPREAVWLAWDTACRVEGEAPPAVTEALAATSAWLVEPTDERRRAAFDAAERCGLAHPAGGAGFAAFLAEGSLAPAHLEQAVPAPPGACAEAAAGAILLMVVREPTQADARARACVDRWFALAGSPPPWAAAQAAMPAGAETDAGDGGYDTNPKF